MGGPKSVTANFTQNQYTLAVSVNPSGSGSVTKSPSKSSYVYGEQVILTATANPGYSFSSWSGDASGTTSPTTVTINANKAVTANYNPVAPPPSLQSQWKMKFITERGDTITTSDKVISYFFVNGEDATITIVLQNPLNFVYTNPDIVILIDPGGNCTLPGDSSVIARAGDTFSFLVGSSTPGAILSARGLPISGSGIQATFNPGTGIFQWSTNPNDVGTYLVVFQAKITSPSSVISELVVSIDITQ
jgi:uncharacterized repeat protein (TIGR02543 family)